MSEGPDHDRSVNERLFAWMKGRRIELLLVVIVLLAGAWFKHQVEYDNTRVRLFTAASLVERGTWNVDPWKEQSIDLSRSEDHSYSNKAIGLNLLVFPFHWLIRQVPPLASMPAISPLESHVLHIIGAAIPHAVTTLLVYLLALRWGAARRHGLFLALAYAFGTIAWQHATMFSGHGLTAAFALGSFYTWIVLRDGWYEERLSRSRQVLLAAVSGLLMGWAVITEYPVAFIAILMTAYVLWHKPRWQVVAAFMGGGALMALVVMWYNWVHFGSPFSLSYGALELEEFAEETSQGLMGISLPAPGQLVNLLIMPARGLLAISPVLILMIPGALALWREREHRRDWWFLVASVAVTVLWISGYFGWHSGWAYGSRYMLVLLPFAVLLMVRAPRLGLLGWGLLVVSAVQNGLAVVGNPYPPQEIRNPLVEFIVPLLADGYRAWMVPDILRMPGWLALAPWLLGVGGGCVYLFRWTTREAVNQLPHRQQRGWSVLAGGWLLVVIMMLATVRTKPETVYFFRARQLRDLYMITHEERYRDAAREQILLLHPEGLPGSPQREQPAAPAP